MSRGTALAFVDRLQNLLEEVAKLNASPDADIEFTQQLRDIVLGKIGVTGQAAGGVEALAAAGSAPLPMDAAQTAGLGSQMPMPVSMAGETGLSRGPTPGMDTTGMVAELERALAGT